MAACAVACAQRASGGPGGVDGGAHIQGESSNTASSYSLTHG